MPKLSGTSVALAALVVALAWAWNGKMAQAQNPAPGLNFSIGVAGASGCVTTNGDKTCAFGASSAFTLNVNLDHLPNGVPQYVGFDIYITYTGVEPQGDPNMDVWPDCAFPAVGPPSAGSLGFGCATGVAPAGPSTYTGTIATVPFSCAQSGSIVLHNSDGDTDLVAEPSNVLLDTTPTETLTINCSGQSAVSPSPGGTTPGAPTATRLPPTEEARTTATAQVKATATAQAIATAATKTPTGGTSGGKGGGGGIPGWAIALIIVGGIAGAGGAGYAGWRYWQSRTPAGGAT